MLEATPAHPHVHPVGANPALVSTGPAPTSPPLGAPASPPAPACETLSALELLKRERGIVCGFADQCFAHKYMCMGVLPGSHVELVRKAPFGQTCYFKIDGRTLAVRKEEAACLLLQRLAERL